VILLLHAEVKDDGKRIYSVELPEIFREQSELVRVIAITSKTGCQWAPGDHIPDGLAMWPADPDGEETIRILVDTVSASEIYTQLFEESSKSEYGVWSIGTKQVWFGKLPARPTADALYEVGDGLVGDDGKVAVLRKLETWRVQPELTGGAFESDILIPGGKKDLLFSELRKKSKSFQKIAGLSGRSKTIERVAGYPKIQKSSGEQLVALFKEYCSETTELVSAIDASDGFMDTERRMIEGQGILLNRPDDLRRKYDDADTSLLDSIVNGIQSAISDGHSLAPIRIQLEDIIAKVKPLSTEELVEKFNDFNFKAEEEKLSKALENMPNGPLLRIGTSVARGIKSVTSRVILSFLYVWALATTLFEIFDEGKTHAAIPLPQSMRQIAAYITIALFILMTLLVVAGGLLLNRAAKLIARWGQTTGVQTAEVSVANSEKFLQTVTLNDWVLSRTRRVALEELTYLLDALTRISTTLSGALIERHEELAVGDISTASPNPAVQSDFNAVAAVGVFKSFETVIEILRNDIATILQSRLALRVHELRGIGRADMPERLLNDIEQPLNEYVLNVVKRGALSQDLAQSEEAGNQRRELAATYWRDVSAITKIVQSVVLIPDQTPIVQFINPNDLLTLDQAGESAVNIRFAPEPSREQVNKLGLEGAGLAGTVIFTESTACAGCLRLVGFRDGLVKYS
jgi:hypothetical protein